MIMGLKLTHIRFLAMVWACFLLITVLCSCDVSGILDALEDLDASSSESVGDAQEPVDMDKIKNEIGAYRADAFVQTDAVTEYVRISVLDHGDIIIRLCPSAAPITVENFQKLVGQGFYDGMIFHRIIQNFMIQGGGFTQGGAQKQATTIKGEFSANGVDNDLLHVRGVISMARTNVKDSATSQFFICDATSQHLDGQYAAFGYVLAGMETVDSIAAVDTTSSDAPLTPVVIESITFVKPIE